MGIGINLIKNNKEIICLSGIPYSEIESFNKKVYGFISPDLVSKCIINNHLVIPAEINFEECWMIINNEKIRFNKN
jgi:hypothetical protein